MFLPSCKSIPCAVGAILCLGAAGQAQPPDEALLRDLWHTVQARKLLLDDPVLGRLNVGVKVTNRSAVLWGPVPSPELAARAEQRLRSMFELIDIHNQLSIEPEDNPVPGSTPAPDMPQFLPDVPPPDAPIVPRRPVMRPTSRVELAGIEPSGDHVTAHSSPAGQLGTRASLGMVHIPFLGSIPLPR